MSIAGITSWGSESFAGIALVVWWRFDLFPVAFLALQHASDFRCSTCFDTTQGRLCHGGSCRTCCVCHKLNPPPSALPHPDENQPWVASRLNLKLHCRLPRVSDADLPRTDLCRIIASTEFSLPNVLAVEVETQIHGLLHRGLHNLRGDLKVVRDPRAVEVDFAPAHHRNFRLQVHQISQHHNFWLHPQSRNLDDKSGKAGLWAGSDHRLGDCDLIALRSRQRHTSFDGKHLRR